MGVHIWQGEGEVCGVFLPKGSKRYICVEIEVGIYEKFTKM